MYREKPKQAVSQCSSVCMLSFGNAHRHVARAVSGNWTQLIKSSYPCSIHTRECLDYLHKTFIPIVQLIVIDFSRPAISRFSKNLIFCGLLWHVDQLILVLGKNRLKLPLAKPPSSPQPLGKKPFRRVPRQLSCTLMQDMTYQSYNSYIVMI